MAIITAPLAKVTRTVHFFSGEKYLNWERNRPKEAGKHEYINGKVITLLNGDAVLKLEDIYKNVKF